MLGKSLIPLLLILAVSTSAALAAGTSSTSTKPAAAPYAKAVQAIKKKKFDRAIVLLRKVVRSKPSDADAWNQLGFSYRKTDRLDEAFTAYGKALAIDPGHRGANEYLGELYLRTKQPKKARERLAKLKSACFFGCEEFDDLKKQIESYEARMGQ